MGLFSRNLISKVNLLPLVTIAVIVFSSFFLNTFPVLYHARHTPENKWFTGQASWFDPWDLNLYISAVGEGLRGNVIFENLYDSGSREKLPVFLFYTVLGKLFSSVNISSFTLYYAASAFTILLLALVIWWFTGRFLEDQRERCISMALVFFAGGFGWAFFPNFFSSDVNQPGFTLANAIQRPHEAVSLSLFLLSLGFFWLYQNSNKYIYLILGSTSLFLFLFFHPYNIVSLTVITSIFGLYLWFKNGSLWFLKTLLSIAFVGLIYYLIAGRLLLYNPTFSGQVSQPQPSPSLLSSLAGWGILLPFMIIAILSKPRGEGTLFLIFWFVSQWSLTYLPIGIQKLMIRGLWIPAVLLSTLGIKLSSRTLASNYLVTASLVIILSSFSTFYTFRERLAETSANRWLFLTKEEGSAIKYLGTHGKDGEGILASYRISNIIPAWTNKKVWAGHEFQSPNFTERTKEIYKFYSGKLSDKEMVNLLKQANISWVFFGPEEKEVDKNNFPANDFLEKTFQEGEVAVFRVR